MKKSVDLERRKAKQKEMGWTKRETQIQMYKLVLLYIQSLRGYNHRKEGIETAECINKLTLKLIDDS